MAQKYYTIKFILTESQIKKIKHGVDTKTSVSLRLSRDLVSERGIPLLLTANEYKKYKMVINIILVLVQQD